MNPFQFCSEAVAKSVLELIGPLGAGGSVFIPDYLGPFVVPGTEEQKFFHLHLFNGFTANCGLINQNIIKYGPMLAKQFAVAEMKAEGRWVIGY